MGGNEKVKSFLEKYKYPLLALAVGILLMTVPVGEKKSVSGEESSFREMLCAAEGVGRAEVLVSEKGVVVVCDGADSAEVRLNILRCIKSYTGFGSEKVTILKMKE